MFSFSPKGKALWLIVLILVCFMESNEFVWAASSSPKKIISIGTAGTGGSMYVIGGGMAKILAKYAGIEATAEVTGGSVENCKLLNKREMDIAFAMGDVAYDAYNGIGVFKEKMKILALFGIYTNRLHFVTLESTGIEKISDLKGKRVAVGPPGSGTEVKVKLILGEYGLVYHKDFKPEFISFNEAIEALKDGNIDAAIVSAAPPVPAIVNLSVTHKIKLLPVEEDMLQRISKKYPYYIPDWIKAGTYKGVDSDVRAIAIKGVIICRDDLEEELAYTITKTILEHRDELELVHVAAKEITLENAIPTPIPLHPGSVRYLKEKGLLK